MTRRHGDNRLSLRAERTDDPETSGKTSRTKKRILFLCTGNSCRSQMAEGWCRHLLGDIVEVYSAGTVPHQIDPSAVRVMKEAGVDISSQTSNPVEEYLEIPFDLVVTVCDSARESCPAFPGRARTIHRSFEDPPSVARKARDEAEALVTYRKVRDEIRDFVAGLKELL